jgi:hypothetical protein
MSSLTSLTGVGACPLVSAVVNLQDLCIILSSYGKLKVHLNVNIVAIFLILIRTILLYIQHALLYLIHIPQNLCH